MDISKIKLYYEDVPSAGKEIHADFGQEFNCIEFKMRGDTPQPITWTYPNDSPPTYFFGERWIQFKPKEWSDLIEAVFKEMVRLWNKEYGHSSNSDPVD